VARTHTDRYAQASVVEGKAKHEMINHIAAFNESGIDDTWYSDVTTFARDTPRLNTPMLDYSSAGMVLFAVLILTA
jgi:hypothetical protein